MIYRHGAKPLILLAVLLGLFAYNTSAQNNIHVVVKGDTLYSLSRLYRISQEEIMRHNRITDPSRIFIGMRLVIPSVTDSRQPVTAAYSEYLVVPNDTLYSIARIHNVPLQSLCEINGLSKTYKVKIGDKIKIPRPAAGTIITGTAVATTARKEPAQAALQAAPQISPQAVPQPVSQPAPMASAKKADSSLRWPIQAKEVLYMDGKLTGVFVSGEQSASIKSLSGGRVSYASPHRSFGNVVIVEAEGAYTYFYGACETLSVKKGDRVELGTELGKLGINPMSGKPDLIFMVFSNSSPIDPAKAPRI